jgi:SEC-C motif domain protein
MPLSRHKKALSLAHSPCPCGLEASFAQCCGQWHAGFAQGVHAPTPEALMRSRYSAYVVGDLAYLLGTWHASTAPGDLELAPTQWLGLEVLSAAQTGEAGRMHEISRFAATEQGRWLYIDGQQIEPATKDFP